MSLQFKVMCLLSVCFGFVRSTTTVLQPSASMSASYSVEFVTYTETISESLRSSAHVTAASGNLAGTPSPSSTVSVQSSITPDSDNLFLQAAMDLKATLGPIVEELNGKITKEIDPTRSTPRDVNVIDTLSKMMVKGEYLLTQYNNSGNSTGDFFNATEGLGLVLTMEKFDCLQDRSAALPDRSDKEIGETLAKFTDYVSLKLNCPRIIKNATQSKSSRKRRDVQIEVTMEVSSDEEVEEDDFHEFQLLHHPSRIRRDVPSNCGPLKCNVQRFETTLAITNREYNASLENSSSPSYDRLEKQIEQALKSKLNPYHKVDAIRIKEFDPRTSSSGVKAVLYLDVVGPGLVDADITGALKNATNGTTLDLFEVDPSKFHAIHRIVVDGNYTEWSNWLPCDNNFYNKRSRTCQGDEHGGVCHGKNKDIKKCDCTYNETAGGNITSPLFPNKYPTGVSCTWVLEAPVNHTVKLRIEEFQLEKDKKCFYDYMEFFDGVNATEDHQLNKRRCGKQDSFTIESTGQKLLVKFTSDKSETYKGFRAVWETKEIKKRVIEYVEQHVTALVMIYSPTVNDTHYPLGTATTCSSESQTNDKECVFEDKVFIISRLISVQMDRSLPLDGDNRMVINFEHIMNEKLFPTIYKGEKQCVSWNKEANELRSTGGWTRRGCTVMKTNITHTSCACDKEGLFAVVGKEKAESQKLKLLANTYIGIGISFFILILAIVHIVWKVEIHGGEVMRINMCAAIIVMQCVFLIGAHVKAQQTLCGFLAFAVYFSVLAEFCWLLLHGLRIHGKIKKIFASNLNIEIVYVVIGWGLPMLLALIAIGVQIDLKNPDDVCWEAAAGSAMWGYAGPVIIIALFNVAVLVKLLIPTEDVKNGYDYEEMRFRVIKDAIFLALFGLTCTFAYQAVEKERFTEQYVLTTFVVLQAIAMFVFGREGRKDFIKRPEKSKPDESTADIQAAAEAPENIYENIEDVKPETDLGEGQVKRPRKRNAANKQSEKITVSTLKNLNIYKEGGQYVIEA